MSRIALYGAANSADICRSKSGGEEMHHGQGDEIGAGTDGEIAKRIWSLPPPDPLRTMPDLVPPARSNA